MTRLVKACPTSPFELSLQAQAWWIFSVSFTTYSHSSYRWVTRIAHGTSTVVPQWLVYLHHDISIFCTRYASQWRQAGKCLIHQLSTWIANFREPYTCTPKSLCSASLSSGATLCSVSPMLVWYAKVQHCTFVRVKFHLVFFGQPSHLI